MKKKLTAMVLALVVALSMVPGAAALGNTVDIENDKGTITVKPTYNNTVVSDQEVTLYKVGVARTENNNLVFDLADSLSGVEIDLNKGTITVDQVKELYSKISGLETAEKDALTVGKATTTEEGAKFEDLGVAVYLVAKTNSSRYSFDPFLLYLPFTNDEGSEWVFDVVAEPKTTHKSSPTPDKSVTVKKVWVDNNDEKGLRPEAIEVQLLKDGQPYGNPVVLDKSVKWSYIWRNLDKNSEWSVVELTVEGYTSSVSKSGNTFTITNTLDDEPPTEIPDEPTPTDPADPPEEIEDPDVPLGDLPQTGLLQWPIPLMAMAGVLLFFGGFMADRKARRSED